jgi:hypothetical protein
VYNAKTRDVSFYEVAVGSTFHFDRFHDRLTEPESSETDRGSAELLDWLSGSGVVEVAAAASRKLGSD